MRRIIMLGYESRVGKDTIADLLVTKGYLKLTFAAPLHDAINTFKERVGDTSDTKYRNAMIALANECKQVKTDDVFARIVLAAINNHPDRNIVISDVRYLNEYVECKKLGAVYVKVERKNRDTRNPSIEEELSTITPDYIISNDGDMVDLIKKVNDLIAELDNSGQ